MRQKSDFVKRHPLVLMIYLAGGLVLTMCTMHPLVLAVSLILSGSYGMWLQGSRCFKQLVWVMIPVFVFTTLVFPIFSHNGITPLFYVNGMAVTLETVLYGVAMSVLFLDIFLWFQVGNALLDSEKFLYLFGHILPSIGLLISMVFRMIPLMQNRFRQIQEGQKGLGRGREESGIVSRGRMLLKEISILMSWSLEESMETSVSMESRGYGVGRRTYFHLFRWKKTDVVWLAAILVLYVTAVVVICFQKYRTSYFPKIVIKQLDAAGWTGIAAFAIAGLLPFVPDVIGEWRERKRV